MDERLTAIDPRKYSCIARGAAARRQSRIGNGPGLISPNLTEWRYRHG